MGRTAASMVMAAVRGESIAKRVELPTSLVVRDSSGGASSSAKPGRSRQTAGRNQREA
jgi:hypothetical protein